MKSLYKKSMTVKEIEEAADKSWKKLDEVSIYLNEAGKQARECHSIISKECTFSDTIEELKNNLTKIVNEQDTDIKIRKMLNFFIKNFLND